VRIAWFDCFSGISGDMCLGALQSAGWPAPALESLPGRLKLEGVTIVIAPARRGPFAATQVEVRVAGAQPHRHLRHVLELIEAGDVAEAVRARAAAVFRRLAAAEAEVHGSTPEKVHFHEVGAADALVDVVGTLEGIAALGIERVFSSPPRLGGGTVQSEHGVIPVPAPATALLLRGAPAMLGPIDVELTTPTGAALLMTLVEDWGAPPALRIDRIGTGAGSRDLAEQPNVLRILIGEADGAPRRLRRVAVLETALDDENPQYVAALIPRLLEAGALDAMVVPCLMKKGRPGMWLVVVADPAHSDAIASIVLRETSSLGVRFRLDERYELDRRVERVETAFGPIELKIAALPEGGERAVPEFESLRRAAERSGRPLREVADAALAAWRSRA
jgi:uncharacterized protein (TIGR00299 family) protein